jgi:hypothetical protein
MFRPFHYLYHELEILGFLLSCQQKHYRLNQFLNLNVQIILKNLFLGFLENFIKLKKDIRKHSLNLKTSDKVQIKLDL